MKRAAKGLTRITCFGEGLPRLENRVELASDKDEFGMPLARLTHSFDDDAVALWNANFEQGVKVAKATGAKEVWPGKGPVIPTTHLHGGAIMGTERGELGDQQLRPDPRNPESVDGRAVHLPERRRVQPDLHDLRGVAARRRESGGELEDDRQPVVMTRNPSPCVGGRGIRAHAVFRFGRSFRAVSFSIERRSAALNFQLAMPSLTSAPSR